MASASSSTSTPGDGKGRVAAAGAVVRICAWMVRWSRPLAAVGETLVYRVTVNDYNTGPAIGVWVDIQLPAGVSLVSTSVDRGSGCSVVAAGRLHCDLDWLADSAQFGHVVVVVTVTASGDHVLAATTGYANPDPVPNGTITVQVKISGWSVNTKQVKNANAASGYWLIYVDGKRNAISRRPGTGVTGKLTPGKHSLRAELVRENGTPVTPRALSKRIVVNVPKRAATPRSRSRA